jgi:hypothetical protein
LQRFDRAVNQLRARLTQHLDRHVRRNAIFIDDASDEIEVGLRCSRKTHFDFREADFQQQVPHLQFFVHVHRVDQRLIAVAQIDAAPTRRPGDDAVRPLPIFQIDRGERAVFVIRHATGGISGSAGFVRNLLFAHGESSFMNTVKRGKWGGREP